MERPYNVKKKEKSQHNYLVCHWPAWWQCDLVCAATMGFSINMLRPYNTKHFLTFLNGLQDDLFRHCHTVGSPHPLAFTGILISRLWETPVFNLSAALKCQSLLTHLCVAFWHMVLLWPESVSLSALFFLFANCIVWIRNKTKFCFINALLCPSFHSRTTLKAWLTWAGRSEAGNPPVYVVIWYNVRLKVFPNYVHCLSTTRVL